MPDRRLLRNVDWALVAAIVILIAFSSLMIASGSRTEAAERYGDPNYFLKRQIIFAVSGLILMAVVMMIDYNWLPRYANILYGANLALLLLVLLFGKETNGAQSWFEFGPFKLQPAEFAKPAMIITLATMIIRREGIYTWGDVAMSFLHLAPALALVLRQPDIGSSLVFLAIWIGMLLMSGLSVRKAVALLGTGLAVVVGGVMAVIRFGLPPKLEKFEYVVHRLTVFINPAADPTGTGVGYHLNQSKIAIGSGGFAGRGLFEGSQAQLNFLPEQHTDFIFSVIGEEFGFLGGMIVLGLLFFIIWRGVRTMALAKDPLGALLAAGVTSMILFHVLQNVGMTMGVMPITGIPLPLVSYGGSSLWSALISLGLLLNVHMRRQKILF